MSPEDLPPTPGAPGRRRRGEAGFSLAEMVVTSLVVLMVILVTLVLFDTMSKTSRAQVHLTELQQSQRFAQRELVRMTRMAGRGGLTADPEVVAGETPDVSRLAALEVRNNVGLGGNGGQEVVVGEGVMAVAGSDVLIVRGVFNSPVYLLEYTDPAVFQQGVDQVVVRSTSLSGATQDLTPLVEAIDEGRPEALVLTDALGDAVGVVELDPDASVAASDSVTLVFRTTGGSHADLYSAMSTNGAYPNFLKVLTVGILEEYRYFVTEEDGDRRLARARVYPNTEVLHGAGTELDLPVVDHVADLQVALAFDSHLGGGYFDCDADAAGADDDIVTTGDGAADDWLFNLAGGDEGGEALAESPWQRPAGGWPAPDTACNTQVRPRLYYLRIGTVARAERPDPAYEGEVLEGLEDRTYGTGADDHFNGNPGRLHRWRVLQTTVDLRSL